MRGRDEQRIVEDLFRDDERSFPPQIRSIRITPVPSQRLFTVSAAAAYLGISDDSLRKYADLGQIPVYRFNGRRAFKLEDLNQLIDRLPAWHDGRALAGRTEGK